MVEMGTSSSVRDGLDDLKIDNLGGGETQVLILMKLMCSNSLQKLRKNSMHSRTEVTIQVVLSKMEIQLLMGPVSTEELK